jgi:hypothetical protein
MKSSEERRGEEGGRAVRRGGKESREERRESREERMTPVSLHLDYDGLNSCDNIQIALTPTQTSYTQTNHTSYTQTQHTNRHSHHAQSIIILKFNKKQNIRSAEMLSRAWDSGTRACLSISGRTLQA